MATKKTSKKTAARASKKTAAKKTSRSAGGGGKAASAGSKGGRRGAGRRKGVNVLLREVDPEVIDVLKARAKREGRSLQQELHQVLRRGAKLNHAEALAMVEEWHARFAGRDFGRSEDLIREDRDR